MQTHSLADIRSALSAALQDAKAGKLHIENVDEVVSYLLRYDDIERHVRFYDVTGNWLLQLGHHGPASQIWVRLFAHTQSVETLEKLARCAAADAAARWLSGEAEATDLEFLVSSALDDLAGLTGGTDATSIHVAWRSFVASELERAVSTALGFMRREALAQSRAVEEGTALEIDGQMLDRLIARDDLARHGDFYRDMARRLYFAGQTRQTYQLSAAHFLAGQDGRELERLATCFIARHGERIRQSDFACDQQAVLRLGDPAIEEVLSRASPSMIDEVFLAALRAEHSGVERDGEAGAGSGAAASTSAAIVGGNGSDVFELAATAEELRPLYLGLIKQNALVAARNALQKFQSRWPRDDTAYVDLARIDFLEGNYEAAAANASRALEINSFSAAALTVVFQVYRTRIQNREALDHLDRLAAEGMDPDRLAKLAEMSGHFDRADAYHRQHAANNPSDDRGYLAYATYLQRIGSVDKLQVVLAEAPDRLAGNPRFQALRAEADRALALCRPVEAPSGIDTGRDLNTMLIDAACRRRRPPTARVPGRRMKVAIVIGSLGPGGAERQCVTLCQSLAPRLDELGIADLRLFVSSLDRNARDSFYLPLVQQTGIEAVQYFDRTRQLTEMDFPVQDGARDVAAVLRHLQPKSRGQRFLQLGHHLRAYQPDVVYGWLDETLVQCGALRSMLPGCRIVGRWGSMPPSMGREVTPQRHLEAAQLRDAYRLIKHHFADTVFLANSAETARTYEQWIDWPPSTVGTIYNGYDFAAMEPASQAGRRLRAELGIPDTAFVFGTVFRMSEEKRPFLWIELAARIAARAGRSCHFVIVGDGPLMPQVREAAARVPGGIINIVGRQTEVGAWYDAMDGFMLTSSVEGMSNAVLEAQYFRRPVVCFDVGGLAEGVVDGETGHLLPEGDIDGYVEKAVRLVDDPVRTRSMGETARAYVTAKFSIEALVRNTIAAFNRSPTAASTDEEHAA